MIFLTIFPELILIQMEKKTANSTKTNIEVSLNKERFMPYHQEHISKNILPEESIYKALFFSHF